MRRGVGTTCIIIIYHINKKKHTYKAWLGKENDLNGYHLLYQPSNATYTLENVNIKKEIDTLLYYNPTTLAICKQYIGTKFTYLIII